MKVLIVDDNAAIREILSELLSVDYETRMASSLDEAADVAMEFHPDATLLDYYVGDANGLELIDTMLARGVQLQNVIILTSNGGEQVPKDSVSIVGTIQKPFKSTEVLEKIRMIFSEPVREKPKRSLFKHLFGKKEEPKENNETIDIRFGRSYLFLEGESENAYKASISLLNEDCNIMIITSGKIKAAVERLVVMAENANIPTERMSAEHFKIIALSDKEGPDYVGPEMMGTLMSSINEFIDTMERPAVMIDDLDLLIEKNDLNSTLTMLHQIINNGSGRLLTLIASTASDNMTEKDRELLMHSMEIRIFE